MLGSANALISFVRLEHGDIYLINVARIVKSTSNASDQFSIGHSSFSGGVANPHSLVKNKYFPSGENSSFITNLARWVLKTCN